MLAHGREAQARASPDTVLSPLPLWFAHAALLLLSVDTRLRCSEVSRAWRALLVDRSLWLCISLGASSGVARFSEALLRAAVAKAGGQLRSLDITGQPVGDIRRFMLVQDPLARLVREVVAANKGALMELRVDMAHTWTADDVRALLRANSMPSLRETKSRDYTCLSYETAPTLQLLEASVETRYRHDARDMLRNEPPFQALRLRKLYMIGRLHTTADVVAFS